MKNYTFLPEPRPMALMALVAEIEKGTIKIPQFQRDFVWSLQKSADLLDSVLKGYPIGTFIFWKTKEELRSLRNIGGLSLPKTPKGDFIEYVLDGQQRLTSLFAAVKGLKIERADGTEEDFSNFYLDLGAAADEPLVVIERDPDAPSKRYLQLKDLLYGKLSTFNKYPSKAQDVIQHYKDRLNAYQFATIAMKEAPIDVATEVFTRLNVSGKELSIFEIMVAKTFDSARQFDLSEKYDELVDDLDSAGYGTLPSSSILQAVAICIKGEARRKAILQIERKTFVDAWDKVAEAIKRAVDFLRSSIGVPVSQLLPYPSMIVPIAYYFYKSPRAPSADKARLLQDFFWRAGLGERYSRSLDSNLAQDVKKIDAILAGKHPTYDWEVDTSADYISDNGAFATGKAYIKTLLCLLASKGPMSFRDNSRVIISNDWLARSNSKNYHHFFPKHFLKDKFTSREINHIANITLVDDQLNKTEIRAKPPSKYIAHFEKTNPDVAKALSSHYISLNSFGIRDDDYDRFFQKRCEWLSKALEGKIQPAPKRAIKVAR